MRKDDQIEAIEVDPFADLHSGGQVYTRKIKGFYQRLRLYTGWPLLIGFFFLPWLNWGGRQIVLFDLPARQFHVFGITFWPQDFYLLGWILIIAAISLFAVTAYIGRVWCGYTCPQTVWTSIFMWIEELTEGSRNQRIKLDKAPMSFNKFTRTALKHIGWVGVSFITGATFVGYFTEIDQLIPNFFLGKAGFWPYAWIIFFLLATYINAGWLREMVCTHMCPYARIQGVMFDTNTLVVTYDEARGEPRGARKHKPGTESGGKKTKGDCVDCKMCVQVCPVGIDIRHGLQYQCISCALCIDACNSIMDKMNYERGLIRYTTENAVAGNKVSPLRPRLFIYITAITVLSVMFITTVALRNPLNIDVSRDRSRLYFQTNEGLIENSYTLKVMNMSQQKHNYTVGVEGMKGVKLIGNTTVDVASGEVVEIPVRLQMDPANIKQKSTDVLFTVQETSDPDIKNEHSSRFTGPSWR